MKISDLRREYGRDGISIKTTEANPISQFEKWFNVVLEYIKLDPTSMVLSTADGDGQPSSRIVLLKEYDKKGFVFYTNYRSRKGMAMMENTKVCLLFFWPKLERQVKIEGYVEKVSREESQVYFKSRPYDSQIGAWTSYQSSRIESRDELMKRFEELKKTYPKDVPLPEFWGGFRVIPRTFEFWQGRPGRLHDRICYDYTEEGWVKYRLSP